MNCNHYDCNNRTALGYCNVTACTNPKYNGSGAHVEGRRIEMSRYTMHAPDDFPYEEYLASPHVDEYDIIGRLGKIEDILYAPDGTERISLDRLRVLVEANSKHLCVIFVSVESAKRAAEEAYAEAFCALAESGANEWLEGQNTRAEAEAALAKGGHTDERA